MKPKILIVDDEKPLRDTLARWFGRAYECLVAPDGDAALRLLAENPDTALVITDERMPGMSGTELLRKVKADRPGLTVIMLTAYGSMDLAVEAMRNGGADDFFQKPITDLRAFELCVARAVEKTRLKAEVASLKAEVASLKAESGAELENFIGNSPAMEKLYRLIRKVAPTNASVLIEGPSGTGKELTAQAIHRQSARAQGPFVAVECAAFSADLLQSELFGYDPGTFTGGLAKGKTGCIEAAHGGTLFLDEIGEIDLPTQIALLRTLETRCVRHVGGSQEIPVDFRLVSATNRDLRQLVASGTFREDLYYRLNVVDIRTPALKDHPEDIAPMVARFLKDFARNGMSAVSGIEPAALKALEDYDWPGNVRQLRNVIEKMTVLATGPKLTLEDLPVEIGERPSLPSATPTPAPGADASDAKVTLADSEKRQILATLEKCGGNKTKAADELGISRRTLHRKLKDWKLES